MALPISQLRDVTCHMELHSITWYSIYLPRRDGKLSEPTCRYPAMHRPGVEPAIFRSLVRRPTATLPSQPNGRHVLYTVQCTQILVRCVRAFQPHCRVETILPSTDNKTRCRERDVASLGRVRNLYPPQPIRSHRERRGPF